MLDRAKTKDEILERYLNTVFFGNNAYGIQAASETYFGKTVDQLTFIEAAFLAGLVRSPSGYDLRSTRSAASPASSRCSSGLVEDEFLTEAEATQIGNEFVLPDRSHDARPHQPAHLLHRGAARLPAQPLEPAR